MKKNNIIYADNAATTKLNSDAFEAMIPYLVDNYGNASQPYSFARKPKQALKEARTIIAECINALPEEIFFTSGGTESDNWAIKGTFSQKKEQGGIVTSVIEHHAILRACEFVERLGCKVSYISVDGSGLTTASELEKNISDDTKLVSIMYANNEIGTIQPIKELCETAHKHGALFHTDAVQAVGHVKIDVKELGVDMLSASAHKFNGPKGIGFLYIKKGTPIYSYMNGGSQEFGMRAGTENVAAIVGMAVALKENCLKIQDQTIRLKEMEKILLTVLDEAKIDYKRNGINQIPGNLSLSFWGVDGEALLHRLDLMGIVVSTGAACDSVETRISHVLKAINLESGYSNGTIRISLSSENTIEESADISRAIVKILKQ